MNHTCLCLPSQSRYSFTDPGGWKAELGFGGWLVHKEINVWHQELNPDTVVHLSTNWARRWLTSLIKANALTTMQENHPLYRHQTTCMARHFLTILMDLTHDTNVINLIFWFSKHQQTYIILCHNGKIWSHAKTFISFSISLSWTNSHYTYHMFSKDYSNIYWN